MSDPRIWVLLGHRRGDNNQLLALAEGLGVSFETRTVTYRSIARMWMKLFHRSIAHVEKESRRFLGPPWPDLVIGIGRRSVAVACWIKRKSGGRTRIVRLGHPRAPNRWFDLVITTRQYPVPDGENVLRLPMAMNRFRQPPEATDEERAALDAMPRPHLLLSLGGKAPMWELDLDVLKDALAQLVQRVIGDGGTLIVASSPRTPPEALALVRKTKHAVLLKGIRYPVALADADTHFVTADSVSMISEAIMTGKPVGLIFVAMSRGGRRALASGPEQTNVRDIRRFWSWVEEQGLVGTVASPRRGTFEEPVEMAVAAVKSRLNSLFR